MKQVMAVISSERLFSKRFCDYVNKSGHIIYTAVPFDSIEGLEAFKKEHSVPILLCDEGMLSEEAEAGVLYDVRTVPLSDYETGESGRKSVFKYQSAEEIVREIMEVLGDVRFSAGIRISGRPVSVRAIYSPVSDEHKTFLALAAAICFSKNQRTLYVNFEETSGLMDMLESENCRGLSEAFYYLKQGELTPERIASLIHVSGPLQFIPPVHTADDLSMICGEDCVNLIRTLLSGSSYDMVVADLPPHLSLSSDILDISEFIYVPYSSERPEVRYAAFLENLRRSEKEAVIGKIKKISIPDECYPDKSSFGHGFATTLLYGGLGDYLAGVFNDEDG
ncbi:MAG: hypothetical protein MJ059_02960 [Lachnospiraceae bacterium]|nr:hypothetical protein [Lachnospiraceae bacterium]